MLEVARAGALRRLLPVALAVLVAGACAEQSRDPGVLRVGLLTPGSIRDGGWNQSAYEGLERIRDELGAEVAHQETHTPQEFEDGFRDFAQRGFDLVVGHGFEFQDAAVKVGAGYPDTVFLTTSGSAVRTNVAPIVFELEQATYVLGYTAALLSRSVKLGLVGGVEIPSVASTFLAFEAGALHARPGIDVVTTYIGNWSDVAAAREATRALIDAGADVLIHNANEAARGFFQAVRESPRVYAFGTNRNQNEQAPESVIASATLDVSQALLQVARRVDAGRFEARLLRFGLRDRVIRVEWNERLEPLLSARDRAAIEDLVHEIESGSFKVPRRDF
ncbi:MAG: BMP family protein [Proteobacteria bacterium]|nr:BMP family protein [Pseudomonadota bacterium]